MKTTIGMKPISSTARVDPAPATVVHDLAALYRYRELLRNLVAKELKLKYRGSVLGLLWSLLNPLFMIVVYTLAFRFIVRIPLENYPLFLVIGLLHWNFFASSTLAATDAVISNANLIRKIYFPRVILPIATVVFQFIQLLLTLIVFALAYLPLGGQLWAGLAVYPLSLILQVLFVIGVALGVSALTVFYRDLKHLIEVGLLLLFWLTPIIYNFTMIPESAQPWFRLNPMVPFVIAYQDLFYLQEWPSLGNWALMVLWTIAALGLGYVLFRRLEGRFAEEL